ARLHARAVVDDKADMAALDPALLVIGHPRQVNELVAHVDEGAALVLAAQVEVENLAVPGQRLVDIADLDRDMVDADQPGLLAVAHLILPHGMRNAHLIPTDGACASAVHSPRRQEDHEEEK